MRVLFVYKFLTIGGVETVLRSRLRGLPACDVQADVWFLQDLGGSELFTGYENQVHVGNLSALHNFIASRHFDVVTTIDTEEIFPGFAIDPSLPALVVEAHSAYDNATRVLELAGDTDVKAIFVPSNTHARFLKERTPVRWPLRVVPNPLAEEFVLPPVEPVPRAPRPPILWLGRLDSHKNWEGAIEIASALRREVEGFELWMVGATPSSRSTPSHSLPAHAESRRVIDILRWLPTLPHQGVRNLMDIAHASGGCLLVTSRGESFGMTMMEALARRLPIIAPRAGTFAELAPDLAAELSYDPMDPQSAIEPLKRLLDAPDDSARMLTATASERIRRQFAPTEALKVLADELRAVKARDQEYAPS